MVGYNVESKPAWLEGLLSEKFFSPCVAHSSHKKNERNIYCLECAIAVCQHCLPIHPHPHKLLQIRRYVYHDVIRMQDIQKLLDCGFVQPYIINSAKVVFLNQRPQPRPAKGQGNNCETCNRSLQDLYKYCSVACKVEASSTDSLALVVRSALMKDPLFYCDEDDDEDDEDHKEQEQLSPNSVHRGPNLNSPTSSSSTANDSFAWGSSAMDSLFNSKKPAMDCLHNSKKPAMDSLYNSKKQLVPSLPPRIATFASSCKDSWKLETEDLVLCRALLPCMKRRKGVPRRSPIF